VSNANNFDSVVFDFILFAVITGSVIRKTATDYRQRIIRRRSSATKDISQNWKTGVRKMTKVVTTNWAAGRWNSKQLCSINQLNLRNAGSTTMRSCSLLRRCTGLKHIGTQCGELPFFWIGCVWYLIQLLFVATTIILKLSAGCGFHQWFYGAVVDLSMFFKTGPRINWRRTKRGPHFLQTGTNLQWNG
jgi:hypothetical protein